MRAKGMPPAIARSTPALEAVALEAVVLQTLRDAGKRGLTLAELADRLVSGRRATADAERRAIGGAMRRLLYQDLVEANAREAYVVKTPADPIRPDGSTMRTPRSAARGISLNEIPTPQNDPRPLRGRRPRREERSSVFVGLRLTPSEARSLEAIRATFGTEVSTSAAMRLLIAERHRALPAGRKARA